jgi:hypothetical protein
VRSVFRSLPALILGLVILVGVPGPVCSQARFPGAPPRGTPAPPAVPAFTKIRFENGLVTAELRAVPIQQALTEFAARTGVVFEIGLHDLTPVTVALYRVGVAEAVTRIVGQNNAILYYAAGDEGAPQVNFVRVIARANKPAQPSLTYIGTGSITKRGEDAAETPEQAVRVLMEGGTSDAKQKAIEILVEAKSEAAPDALKVALDDEAPEVRAAAVEGLASLGKRELVPLMVKALKDKNPGVRQSALTGIALVGSADNLKDVRPLVKDRDASVAAAAEGAVRKLASRRP